MASQSRVRKGEKNRQNIAYYVVKVYITIGDFYIPRAPGMRKPLEPRKKVTAPRQGGRITELKIDELAELHAQAYNLTPAEARAQVLRRLQMIRKR